MRDYQKYPKQLKDDKNSKIFSLSINKYSKLRNIILSSLNDKLRHNDIFERQGLIFMILALYSISLTNKQIQFKTNLESGLKFQISSEYGLLEFKDFFRSTHKLESKEIIN